MALQCWKIDCLRMYNISDEVKVYQGSNKRLKLESIAGGKNFSRRENLESFLPRRMEFGIEKGSMLIMRSS